MIMELLLGKKIKELRKAKGITQEQMAEAIGISFQAISKWETGISLPDITLAPAIARYFGVTMDELFDFDLREMNEKVEAIRDEAYKFRETDPQRASDILENGLKQYPENDILLNNLLCVIDYTQNPDETIALANRLIDKTCDYTIKLDAFRFLAYAYNAKGATSEAVAALEQIPEIYFTKLSEMAFVLTGKAKQEAAERQKWLSFETLLQMMWDLAECYEADGEIDAAIQELSCVLVFIETLNHDAFRDHYTGFFEKQIERLKNIK